MKSGGAILRHRGCTCLTVNRATSAIFGGEELRHELTNLRDRDANVGRGAHVGHSDLDRRPRAGRPTEAFLMARAGAT